MANFIASARSNYFTVKDDKAFIAALNGIPDIEVHKNPDGQYCILVSEGDSGAFPTFAWDDELDDQIEIDLFATVAHHLVDDEVAIFMESGAENLRYITGYAIAINNKQDLRTVDLMDIYKLVDDLTNSPDKITQVEY